MQTLENVTRETWVLCHNSTDTFHIIELQAGGNLQSGQPYVEQFDTEEELKQRINELNPVWYSQNIK